MVGEKITKAFGFWAVQGWDNPTDTYEEMLKYHNTVDKQKVIKYLENLPAGYGAGFPHKDFRNGERIELGIIIDEPFVTSFDFLHFYKTSDIGIPYDYEEYIKDKI